MSNHRARFSWADLPQELLLEIAIRFATTQPEFCTFRAVCKCWKNSVPRQLVHTKRFLHSLFPCKIINFVHQIYQPLVCKTFEKLRGYFPYQDYEGKELVLVPVSMCLIRPKSEPMQRPWLACIEEVNPGKIILRKRMSRSTFKKLPESVPRELDLSQFTVSEIYKGHYVRFVNVKNNNGELSLTKDLDGAICKVVLLSNPTRNSNHSIEDFFAIILCRHPGKIVAIRLSDGLKNSVAMYNIKAPGYYNNTFFIDVVKFKGQVYAVDLRGCVYAIDYHNLTMSFVTDKIVTCNAGQKKLFESSGELYMVNKGFDRACGYYFEMYKLDANSKNWVLIENFGDDRVLFITSEGCFCGSVTDFPNWTGNCIVIYFHYLFRENESKLSCIRVLSHQQRDTSKGWTVKGWFESGINVDASLLDYSSVFWPPPAWLSSKP